MCLFPIPNNDVTGVAFRSGIHEFKCDSCPECLKEKASSWALRGYFEAKVHADSCMVTLTYDNYMRNSRGEIVGELPPDTALKVNRRDIQLFVKRLRKWWSKTHNDPIKVLYCSEYGSRTHRAHYHAILFGVKFPDTCLYKRSRRGNPIYKSNILTRLWGHGICTVDSQNVTASCISYCTKYLAKSRSEDTFMGFSHGIGLSEMLKAFNGRDYIVEGRVFPVPRLVWQHVIYNRYCRDYPDMTYKYLNRTDENWLNGKFTENVLSRKLFCAIRNSDPQYASYLNHWKNLASNFEARRLPVSERISLLSKDKFFRYRLKAREVYDQYVSTGITYIPPFSNRVSAHCRCIENINKRLGIKYITQFRRNLRFLSCHESANDTVSEKESVKETPKEILNRICTPINDISSWDLQAKQLNIFED